MSLLVITVTFNKPAYLSYQYELLKKFMIPSFKFIVFDNSNTDDLTNEFRKTCEYLNISYIRIPQTIHTSQGISDRAGKSLDYAIQHTYNELLFRGTVMINDTDLFLVKPFDPISQLGKNQIIGRSHKANYILNHSNQRDIVNLNFFTNQFVIMNFASLPNIQDISFMPGTVEGINTDCGGKLHTYFKNNNIEYDSVKDIPHNAISLHNIDSICDKTFKPYFNEELTIYNTSFSEIFAESFIHLRAGSNWIGNASNLQTKREDTLFTFLCRILMDWKSIITPSGDNKYIISFSLYGNNPKYTYNAIINAKIAEKVYDGWTVRIYYDNTVPSTIINTLKSFSNTECIEMHNTKQQIGHERMLWRFHAASDSNVACMISRDCDSWLSFREAIAVKDWLNSNKRFHIIRDHCYHSQKIMGGMWGIKRGTVSSMKQLCEQYVTRLTYDQGFLADIIYPAIINNVMVHLGVQKTIDGAPSNGYFPDGGIPIPVYPLITEYISTIDIEKSHSENDFHCIHCNKKHLFFIGEMFNNLNTVTRQFVESCLI